MNWRTTVRGPKKAGYREAGYGEAGSASVQAAFATVIVLVVSVIGLQLALVLDVGRRNGAAADFAALGASRAVTEGADGCARARDLAQQHGARVSACDLDVAVATVRTTMVVRTPFGRWRHEARARAAPADYELP